MSPGRVGRGWRLPAPPGRASRGAAATPRRPLRQRVRTGVPLPGSRPLLRPRRAPVASLACSASPPPPAAGRREGREGGAAPPPRGRPGAPPAPPRGVGTGTPGRASPSRPRPRSWPRPRPRGGAGQRGAAGRGRAGPAAGPRGRRGRPGAGGWRVRGGVGSAGWGAMGEPGGNSGLLERRGDTERGEAGGTRGEAPRGQGGAELSGAPRGRHGAAAALKGPRGDTRSRHWGASRGKRTRRAMWPPQGRAAGASGRARRPQLPGAERCKPFPSLLFCFLRTARLQLVRSMRGVGLWFFFFFGQRL